MPSIYIAPNLILTGERPAAVSGLTAERTGGSVAISWDASGGTTSYLLERSSDGGSSWSTVYEGGNTSAADSIAEGQTFFYRVRPANFWGAQAHSTAPYVSYPVSPSGLIGPSDVTYLGFYEMTDRGGYDHAFTVRRVGAETRLLMHTYATNNGGPITEWSLNGLSYGDTITSAHRTNRWSISGTKLYTRNDMHDSIWWDHDEDRLWYLNSIDYPTTSSPYYSSIQICEAVTGEATLGECFKVSLENIRDRKHHGGAMDVPSELQTLYGWPKYLVGFGGYASRMTDQGTASMGLACYAMPDPSAYAASAPAVRVGPTTSGATIPVADYKTLSERNYTDRGVRKYWGYSFTPDGGTEAGQPTGTFAAINGNPVWGPCNYFDGADYRGQNPAYMPHAEPLPGSAPYYNYNGAIQYNTQNWNVGDQVCSFAWDQYVGGFFSTKGLCVVGSLGCGRLYYQTSVGYQEQYGAELHVFDPAQLAEVSAGARAKTAIQPKVIIPLLETMDGTKSFYFHKYAAGYDPIAKKLYVQANRHQTAPGQYGLRPYRIYVYQINE